MDEQSFEQILWADCVTEEQGFQPTTLATLASKRISQDELTSLLREAIDRSTPVKHLLPLLSLHHEDDGAVYDVKVDLADVKVRYGGCNGRTEHCLFDQVLSQAFETDDAEVVERLLQHQPIDLNLIRHQDRGKGLLLPFFLPSFSLLPPSPSFSLLLPLFFSSLPLCLFTSS
jgi:hypothetical protein